MCSVRHFIPFERPQIKNSKAVYTVIRILAEIMYLAAGGHSPEWVSGTWIQPGAVVAVPVLHQSTRDAPTPLLAARNAPLVFAQARTQHELNIPRARLRTFHCSWEPGCHHRLTLLVDWISRWPQEATDHSPAWQTSWPKSTSGAQATVGRCMLFACQVYPVVPSPKQVSTRMSLDPQKRLLLLCCTGQWLLWEPWWARWCPFISWRTVIMSARMDSW